MREAYILYIMPNNNILGLIWTRLSCANMFIDILNISSPNHFYLYFIFPEDNNLKIVETSDIFSYFEYSKNPNHCIMLSQAFTAIV